MKTATVSQAPDPTQPPPGGSDRATLDGLLRRLAEGERDAFAPAFQLLWPKLVGFARTQLSDPDDAEDVAQRAAMKLFAQVDDYDPQRSGLAWALTIVAWECRSWRRQQQRGRQFVGKLEQQLQAGSGAAPSGPDQVPNTPEDIMSFAELLRGAEAVMGELSALDRSTLRAALEEDQTHKDDVGGATFRKRYQRALGRFRDSWRKIYGY